MLYVPIKIYPNRRSVRGCIVCAALWLGLALAGFHFINVIDAKVAVYSLCMVGFAVCVINGIAAMTHQPMIKILDDRFSVYTPFGYAMIRFGEVLIFKRGRVPFMGTLRVEINKSARAKFPSAFGKLLYSVVGLRFTNTVSIPGFMLGANPESVVQMLEKRRLAAIRLEAIGDYNPTALTSVV
ncbi:hypothetical protein SYK_00230 [Pseudodesulfovibrio nedwellii]|uniref:PH domain-containing protein n=1 Tax=Pseudodesulfovibrio nedwellii TaxID=2973072 RepID=A0ABN6S082_9BACT|nr:MULTISPECIES: hypothetical protein [Pseudodesulfovibrio]BDQ35663.1 hypothetical protein SYK_00230 [Pseudodesulfovibrio nedwellii]